MPNNQFQLNWNWELRGITSAFFSLHRFLAYPLNVQYLMNLNVLWYTRMCSTFPPVARPLLLLTACQCSATIRLRRDVTCFRVAAHQPAHTVGKSGEVECVARANLQRERVGRGCQIVPLPLWQGGFVSSLFQVNLMYDKLHIVRTLILIACS